MFSEALCAAETVLEQVNRLRVGHELEGLDAWPAGIALGEPDGDRQHPLVLALEPILPTLRVQGDEEGIRLVGKYRDLRILAIAFGATQRPDVERRNAVLRMSHLSHSALSVFLQAYAEGRLPHLVQQPSA